MSNANKRIGARKQITDVSMERQHAELCLQRLVRLKPFVRDIDRLRR